MIRGGEKRMMFLWVGLAINPFLRRCLEKVFAISLSWNSAPMNKPFPLTSLRLSPATILSIFYLRYLPNLALFSIIFSSITTLVAVMATSQAKGFPP